MGSGPSLALSVADSVLTPGQPTILSEPIDLDYDAFLDEVVALLKYPLAPGQDAVLKECTIEGEGPEEFTVKVTLDGSKLTAFGFGNADDPVLDKAQVSKVTVKRQERSVKVVQYKAYWVGEKEGEIERTANANLLQDPMRIEYYWTTPDGMRQADEETLKAVQPVVDGVMGAMVGRKVIVTLDSEKQAVVSQPIEESIASYDAFFDGLLSVIKEFSKPEVEDLSETKVKLVYQPGNYQMLSWDKEKGSMELEMFRPNGEKIHTAYYTFTKSPVVMESWIEVKGKRTTNPGTKLFMQTIVNMTTTKISGGSWFGLF